MNTSLRRQVMAVSLGGTALALLVTGAGVSYVLYQQAVDARDSELQEAAAAFAAVRVNPSGKEAYASHHSPPRLRVQLHVPDDLHVDPVEAEAARLAEFARFANIGERRVVFFPVEPRWAIADESRDHDHELIVADGPQVTWTDAVGAFILGYLGVAVSLASLVAFAQVVALRRALEPLEQVGRLVRGLRGVESDVRLPEVGPEEIRELLVDVNRLLGRLDAAIHAAAQFTHDAAHELRTPVTVLRTELELALRRDRTVPEYKAALERSLGATTSLGALVEALMSFARVDAGQIERGMAAVRIADLVARVARFAPDADVEVAADDVLRAHPALLEVALANLVRNANRHGGGARRIAYEVDGPTSRLIVDDAGPGLPAQPRLFERFVRGAEPREGASREVGLGLGLALTREIARRHGGDCTLVARPEGGCRAELTLPRLLA